MSRKLAIVVFITLFTGLVNNAVAQIINTVAGTGATGFGGDGSAATSAQFDSLAYVTMDGGGNLFLSDQYNYRIREINTGNIINTMAGVGSGGFGGDGTAASGANINLPWGIAVDLTGNKYISDQANNRIRKINSGGIITTIAGTGTPGYSGDGSAATNAKINTPYGIAVDVFGNVFFADNGNSVIRKINPLGIITTVAGTGLPGYSGDGGAANAEKLNRPTDVAFDGAGSMYIADNANNRIRKVAGGFINTIAGGPLAGFAGDGAMASGAKLNGPMGVKVDAAGNIYVADYYNNRIREINTSGVINTIAGNGTRGYSGDGGMATANKIDHPTSVILGGPGNVYFVDRGNSRLRMITKSHAPYFIVGKVDSFAVCENTDTITVDTMLSVVDSDFQQTEIWSIVLRPAHSFLTDTTDSLPANGGMLMPSRFNYKPNTGFSGLDSFKVRISDGVLADTITVFVRVNPSPPIGPITGHSNACIARGDTLSDIGPGGVWSLSNANATISGRGVLTGLVSGIDTVKYRIDLLGCTDSVSTIVHIYTSANTITGTTITCTGLTDYLTGFPVGGTWGITNGTAVISSAGAITGRYSGLDTVTYTFTNYCGTAVEQHPVQINTPIEPVVIITATPAVVAPGRPDTMVAMVVGGAANAYTYQWYVGNFPVVGATDSAYVSSSFFTYDSVSCVVANGPCDLTTFSWIYPIVSAAGVKKITIEDVFDLSPNPNNGAFTINASILNNKDITFEITDIVGQVVYNETATVQSGVLKKDIRLDSRLANGVYLLHTVSSDGVKVLKFVLNK